MNLTNKFNLPDALVRAVSNDNYTKGVSDYSVTGLLKPPRQAVLIDRHFHEIEEDVSDRIWSLLGQSVHAVCERANVTDLVEKRFFAPFGDLTVSAQIDSLGIESGILTDYKTTTVYKCRPGSPADPEWTAQLNIQLEILRRNGHDAKELRIVGILRDWSKNKARQEDNYPPMNVAVVPVEMWSREKTTAFVEERIALHEAAKKALPECSKEERWAKDDMWALMKRGGKRAVKLFTDKAEADAAAFAIPGHYVETRPGEAMRCALYCSAAKFCSQYQNSLKKVGENAEVSSSVG